jgi:DNA polymerase III sliding clamp (beta) subunit (PCNA family)
VHIDTQEDINENAWVLSKLELKFLVEVASKDTARKNLNGILLDADRRVAVATDGHRLVRCHLSTKALGKTQSLLPREEAEHIMKRAKANDRIVIRPNCDSAHVSIVGRKGETLTSEVKLRKDVMFPPHEKVIPDDYEERVAEPMVGMNAGYLSDALIMQNAAATMAVKLHVGKKLEPIVLQAENPHDGSRWEYVIMPMRI